MGSVRAWACEEAPGPSKMLSMLFPMLWNAADNDVGVGPACSASDYNNCNGAALVGGPDTTDLDMLGKMSPAKLEAQMSKLGAVRAPAVPCRATHVAAAARSTAACAGAGLWHRCPTPMGVARPPAAQPR